MFRAELVGICGAALVVGGEMDQGTLFFVHGTGVRRNAYEATVDRIRTRALANEITAGIVGCYWGAEHEVAADAVARSLPWPRSLEPPAEVPVLDPVDEWGVLLDDPLVELRLAQTAPREQR
jgi:hypothetical protein